MNYHVNLNDASGARFVRAGKVLRGDGDNSASSDSSRRKMRGPAATARQQGQRRRYAKNGVIGARRVEGDGRRRDLLR